MKARSRSTRIAAQLADLKMPGALEALDEVLAGVDGGGTTAAEAIERLLAAQITLRNSRRLATAMRSSRLHRCHIVNIQGNSYRMRRHMELSKAIHPTASRAVRTPSGAPRRSLRFLRDGSRKVCFFQWPGSVHFSVPIDSRSA